jgi:hypothetical protein
VYRDTDGDGSNNVMERDGECNDMEQGKGTTGPFTVLLLGEFGYLLRFCARASAN